MDISKSANKPDSKIKETAAQWTVFTKQFPNGDKGKLVAQTYVDEKQNVSVEIFFKEKTGSLQRMFGSRRKYWSEKK